MLAVGGGASGLHDEAGQGPSGFSATAGLGGAGGDGGVQAVAASIINTGRIGRRMPIFYDRVAFAARSHAIASATRRVQVPSGEAVVTNIVNAVLLRDGCVLLARRSAARKAHPGLWSFPGGHVERGEEFERALHRELREEVGIVPAEYRPLGPIIDPHVATTTYRMYAVTAWHGEPEILDQEHSALQWFALNAATSLPDLALEAYRPLFDGLAVRP